MYGRQPSSVLALVHRLSFGGATDSSSGCNSGSRAGSGNGHASRTASIKAPICSQNRKFTPNGAIRYPAASAAAA